MDSKTDPIRPTPGPWSETVSPPEPRRTDDQRVFNAPILALLVAASIPALYYLQSRQGGGEDLIFRYGLIPRELFDGRVTGLFAHMVLHGGWTHALMNAVGALAFGAPVARLMWGARGAIGFLSLYILCGLLAGGGYAVLHMDSAAPLVGASGAVFGLIGASVRLMTRDGSLLRLSNRRVLMGAATWIGLNVVLGLLGSAPGAGGGVAWEAHIIGLIAGLLLIGPWARLFGRRQGSI